MAGGPLLERDAEIARGEELIAAARAGRGGYLAIEGPPGIGKTALLADLRERAARAGLEVLTATGGELERDFAFGVVRQLFEPVLGELDVLDGAAVAAKPALGLADAPPATDSVEQRYAVVHGLFWLTANLAARRPLMVCVDDLQWADEASQRWLAYLVRRIGGMSVAVVAAFRPAVPRACGVLDALAESPVRLAPLGPGAVRALAEAWLGAEVDDAFANACFSVTGGNALLVEELLADLRERGAEPTAAAAWPDGASIERIARRARRHVAALPEGAAALADAVAVLGDGWPVDVAAQVARIDVEASVGAAAVLAAADVLADGALLRFRHPLVRAAVLDALPDVERAAAHGRAARALGARGAPSAAVASHLLKTPPAGDPWVVERLRAAAREAIDQGTPETAAEYLRRAICEPPPEAEHRGVLREAGRAAISAGAADAPDYLAQALDRTADPLERARLGSELAGALSARTRWREAATVARRALEDARDADRELRLVLEAQLADAARMDRTVGGDEPERLVALAAGLEGRTPGERLVMATASMMGASETAADHAAAAQLAARVAREDAAAGVSSDTGIASNLIRASDLDAAQRFVDARLRDASARGLVRTHVIMLGFRGWIAYARGSLREADDDVAAAVEGSAEVDAPIGPTASLLALIRAEQGRLDDADELIDAHGLGGPLPDNQVANLMLHYRATVRALQLRNDDALADALEVGRRYESFGIRRAVPPWRSLAAVLLAGDDAERALALARDELELAELWGTPLAIGTAQRGLGLVTGDLDTLARAIGALTRSPSRLELAKARLDLGAALRRAGRRSDAREPLRLAMDGAHACGAAALAERAREELRATGARPRGLTLAGAAALTPSERRVARLAADGMTNRQIAQALFVTTATVETHLRHVFQKLEISARTEIPRNLRVDP